MADNHLGGQFEAYLATNTLSSEAATEYRANIRQILDYLAPNKTGGGKLKPAYDLLTTAAEYPGDGNICESLANAIYAAQLTKQRRGSKREYAEKLNREKKRITRNMSVISSKLSLTQTKEGGPPKPTGQNSIEYITMQKRVVEIELSLRQLELNGAISMTQSKLQFQSMIVQLFVQRRFEHCIMATRFYNLIYSDGDNRLDLKKGSDAANFFAEGIGVDPTVAGLDAASAEAIKKVDTLVNAFRNNLKNQRVHAASERLVEAFVVGDFLPSVQTINIESKAIIQQYIQDANDLVKVLVAKDLARAEQLNESLQQQATDYNPSEARSYISGKKTESKLNTRDAKIALRFMLKSKNSNERHNEHARFKTAMARATHAWPSNPEVGDINILIDSKLDLLADGDDMLLVARKDFDLYVATKSWAAVMKDENLSRFIASFHLSKDPQDITRAKLLKQIKNDFTAIFATLKEAEVFYNRGHAAAAWELVDISIKLNPNSLELAQAKALYSGKAANFANTINKAQDFETISPVSAQALTWYLKAEAIHPDSQYAKEGIDRVITAKFRPNKRSNNDEVAANF
tara:strand:- start:2944 stop:4668 length:1725 start_codon:yes stop_codon:yes gene_type:complete